MMFSKNERTSEDQLRNGKNIDRKEETPLAPTTYVQQSINQLLSDDLIANDGQSSTPTMYIDFLSF